MADPIAQIANKKAIQKDKKVARQLRKLLQGDATIVVTLHTGSIFTMVKVDSDSGMRFSGMRSDGTAGRFYIGMVKDIQTLEETKEVKYG